MFNLISFEGGQLIRPDVIQYMFATYTVKYKNDMVMLSLNENPTIQIVESFEIIGEWEAHLDGREEPVEVGSISTITSNIIMLKDFLAAQEDEPDATLIEELNRQTKALRVFRRKTLEANITDGELYREKEMEYTERLKRLRKFLLPSADGETLGIINKTWTEVATKLSLKELVALLNDNYTMKLSQEDKLVVMQPPIIATSVDHENHENNGSYNEVVSDAEQPLEGDIMSPDDSVIEPEIVG